MSWEDQGRQYHMWFGHGTAPDHGDKAVPDPSVMGNSIDGRALALAYGVIAALPASLRGRAETQYQHGILARLQEAMAAWMKGTRLGQATFATRFFGRDVDDPVVRNLHAAALGAATATSHEELRIAADRVADAIKAVGVDQWPRFVVDALDRARDQATVAAVEKSRQPIEPASDAIRPVYPIETAIEVAAAGISGGATAAVRAVGNVILRQVFPQAPYPKLDVAAASATSVRDKLTRYTLNLEHPLGRSKAQWFEKALGFTRQNSDQLARQLVFDEKTAVQTAVTKYGTKFNQVINVVGTNGRTIPVTTAWIRGEDGVAKLVTALPGK
jgi:hypothetical protein